jgi:hypothetical protein
MACVRLPTRVPLAAGSKSSPGSVREHSSALARTDRLVIMVAMPAFRATRMPAIADWREDTALQNHAQVCRNWRCRFSAAATDRGKLRGGGDAAATLWSSVLAALMDLIVKRTSGASAAFIRELMRHSAQFQIERGGGTVLEQAAVDGAIEEMVFAGGALNMKLLGAAGANLGQASVTLRAE